MLITASMANSTASKPQAFKPASDFLFRKQAWYDLKIKNEETAKQISPKAKYDPNRAFRAQVISLKTDNSGKASEITVIIHSKEFNLNIERDISELRDAKF